VLSEATNGFFLSQVIARRDSCSNITASREHFIMYPELCGLESDASGAFH
jgi:hypothetical protein